MCFSPSAPRRSCSRRRDWRCGRNSAGAFVAEINPQQTALSGEVDLCLRGAAGALLPAMVAALAA